MGTVAGTISSYSISNNSIYNKIKKNPAVTSRVSRDRNKRVATTYTMDVKEEVIDLNHLESNYQGDGATSHNNLLPTDYLNSRSSGSSVSEKNLKDRNVADTSVASESQISNFVSKTS
jgi:hypothetical protein